MTESDWDILAAYIRETAIAIGLSDWEFILKREPLDNDDAGAEVWPTEGQKRATIGVHAEFRGYAADKQVHYVLHELLHCHLVGATDIIRLDLWESRAIGQQAYDMFVGGFKRQIEYGVDAIATSWAPMLKSIPWNAEEK